MQSLTTNQQKNLCNIKERQGLRKLFTEYVRYLPLIHSIAFTISTNLACSGKYFRVIDFVFALSYNSILLYYVVGIYQNWCWKFRLGIYYLLLVLTMSLCDYYIGLPITNQQYSDITLILFSLFIIYYIIKSNYDKRCNDRI
jgi:hypothetical protein